MTSLISALSPPPHASIKEGEETSFPTPRTQTTAQMLARLKSDTKPQQLQHDDKGVRHEISPHTTLLTSSVAKAYTFTEEEDNVEDKALNYLDRTGHLTQVAGSQSLLSQELLGDEHSAVAAYDPVANAPSATPQSVARRYGLLTQEDEEEDASGKTAAPYNTPQRKKAVDKNDDGKENNSDDLTLDGSLPSLSLSQLEAVAAMEVPVMASQTSMDAPLSGSILSPSKQTARKNTTPTNKKAKTPTKKGRAMISLFAVVDQEHAREETMREERLAQLQVENDMVQRQAKRKYTRKVSMDEQADAKRAKKVSKPRPLPSLRKKVDHEREEQMAQEAVQLAHRIMQDETDLAKRLLLSMALDRDSPRKPPADWPAPGDVPEGFVWAHYPPLESILKEHMGQYYEFSMDKTQAIAQQHFNNSLVDRTRDLAAQYKWDLPSHRRILRDRIRCYYKTHIQNAKKRLRTMLKNPTKRANAKALVHHYALLQHAWTNKDDEAITKATALKNFQAEHATSM
jgi:hypothetical protein